MHTFFGLTLFIFHCIVAPCMLGNIMSDIFVHQDSQQRRNVKIFALGLWSGLTALLLDLALRFTPGLTRSTYSGLYIFLATMLVVIFAVVRKKRHASSCAPTNSEKKSSYHVYQLFAVLIITLLVIMLLLQNTVMPLTANDPIVHTLIARVLARDLSAAAYPFANADVATGFFLEGVHPLGFPASKALFMIVLGDLDTPWHKPLTAAFFGYLLLNVYEVARRMFGRNEGLLAAATLAVTPIMLNSVTSVHIDPLRVYFFFSTIAVLSEYARNRQGFWLLIGSLNLALCLHVHAGNVIILAFLGSLFFVVDRGPLLDKLTRAALVLFPSILAVSPQFITNYRTYGTIVTTKYGLESLNPQLFNDWLALQRGLGTLGSILINGALAPFTDLTWFSFGFWAAAAGICIVIKRGRLFEPPLLVMVGSFAVYACLLAVAVISGREEFYMNSRYALVMVPFACVFSGLALGSILRESTASALKESSLQNAPVRSLLDGIHAHLEIVIFVVIGFIIAYCTFVFVVMPLFDPVRFTVYHLRRSSWILYSVLYRGSRLTPERTSAILFVGLPVLVFIGTVVGGFFGRHLLKRSAERSGRIVRSFLQKMKVGSIDFLQWLLSTQIKTGVSRKQFAGALLIALIWYIPTDFYFRKYVLRSMPLSALTISAIVVPDVKKIPLMTDVSLVSFLSVSLALKELQIAIGNQRGMTLTLRDSEVFLYGGGQIRSTYDPRSWPLLADKSGSETARQMLGLGFRYIYLPNYASPTMVNSGLGRLIYEPTLTRVAAQSDRSVATLLELVDHPRPVRVTSILDAALTTPFQLEEANVSTWPQLLSRCERFGRFDQGAFEAFFRSLTVLWSKPSCGAVFEDGVSWLSLPKEEGSNEFRLEVETASRGCVALRVFHRVPIGNTGRMFQVDSAMYSHYALSSGDRAVLRFTRPPKANGIAFGLFGGCELAASIRSARIVRVVEE
jgi:Dolichyl-phosphate-mannose-protein mannosyltransferase